MSDKRNGPMIAAVSVVVGATSYPAMIFTRLLGIRHSFLWVFAFMIALGVLLYLIFPSTEEGWK